LLAEAGREGRVHKATGVRWFGGHTVGRFEAPQFPSGETRTNRRRSRARLAIDPPSAVPHHSAVTGFLTAAITGVAALFAVWLGQHLARESNIAADRRGGKTGGGAVQPVFQFLDIAQRASAFHRVNSVLSRTYADNANDVQSRMTRDQTLKRRLRGLEAEPEGPSLMAHAFHVAATAPTDDGLRALSDVYEVSNVARRGERVDRNALGDSGGAPSD